ncbi:MAG: type II toxin-antitoxin system RelE/ParE family toxin [Propionibacteriaceae bacterium]|jgi:mRNA interferase RelE/StbE|nr:type II toxin-antitoxin system RelE/ParE family toxin [Propionibacteriaceae bacterium]
MAYIVRLSRAAKRALAVELSEAVAAACVEFIYGPLAENPLRVGKQLTPPLWPRYSARRGEFRIVYGILEAEVIVEVVSIQHRRDVYRPR